MNIRTVISALILLVSAGSLQAMQYDAPRVVRSGIIAELNLARYEIVIEGNRYSVSQTAEVEIGGSYGAYTMLQPGMRVVYEYLRFDDGRREIYKVRELLPNEDLERA